MANQGGSKSRYSGGTKSKSRPGKQSKPSSSSKPSSKSSSSSSKPAKTHTKVGHPKGKVTGQGPVASGETYGGFLNERQGRVQAETEAAIAKQELETLKVRKEKTFSEKLADASDAVGVLKDSHLSAGAPTGGSSGINPSGEGYYGKQVAMVRDNYDQSTKKLLDKLNNMA